MRRKKSGRAQPRVPPQSALLSSKVRNRAHFFSSMKSDFAMKSLTTDVENHVSQYAAAKSREVRAKIVSKRWFLQNLEKYD